MSLPCIHNRQNCKCYPCNPPGPYYVTVNVGYGCSTPLTPGTINSVTINGVTIVANPDGTYTSPGPNLPIVVNWTAGIYGSYVANGATLCGDVTVSGTPGESTPGDPTTYPYYCCQTFLHTYGSTLTLSSNQGAIKLYNGDPARPGQFFPCTWFGDYILPYTTQRFVFTINSEGSPTLVWQGACLSYGTGTFSPINFSFATFINISPLSDCSGVTPTYGTLTVTV